MSYISIIGIFGWAFTHGKPWENYKTTPFANIFVLLIITFLVCYGLYLFYRRVFRFTINQDSILFRGIFFKPFTISSNQILQIDLFYKGIFSNHSTIVTAVYLTNGDKIIILDPLYRNMAAIKQTLLTNFQQKITPYINTRKTVTNDTGNLFFPEPDKKDSMFLLNILLLVTFSISMLVLLFYQTNRTLIFAFTPLILVMYIGQGLSNFYFILTENTLLIKNHYLFWYEKKYSFTDIIAVNYEIRRHFTHSLRITTRDFNSCYFPAESLPAKSWQDLKMKLMERGIFFVDT